MAERKQSKRKKRWWWQQRRWRRGGAHQRRRRRRRRMEGRWQWAVKMSRAMEGWGWPLMQRQVYRACDSAH